MMLLERIRDRPFIRKPPPDKFRFRIFFQPFDDRFGFLRFSGFSVKTAVVNIFGNIDFRFVPLSALRVIDERFHAQRIRKYIKRCKA
ncbi:hypothetical protein, partial [Pediococcus pentosaceus]|uniref:hypothetical protein n=1 Tax=Pediococcus pentosaceus TaxID=1255 RepID=UPI0023AF011F